MHPGVVVQEESAWIVEDLLIFLSSSNVLIELCVQSLQKKCLSF